MADFNLPVLTSAYADFLAQMKSRDEDAIKMLDGTTSSNLPAGAKRWNATGNKFEKFNGSVWSDLTTLYEIKVRNSDQLNGQVATYYAVANHTHTGYASSTHTHTEYAASSHNHDTAYLGVNATASDSSKLGGYAPSVNATGNTVGLRDSSGDFLARMFRSTYAEQTATPVATADICFRNDAATDNYIRFMSSDAFKLWLTAIGVSITDTNTWRDITDSVSTTSSIISASATAVKTAYDKAVNAVPNFIAGSLVEAESPALFTTASTTMVKAKEIWVSRAGTINVSFNLYSTHTLNAAVGQIYINNVAVGTSRSTTSTVAVTYTETITVNKGDLVQIYVKRSHSTQYYSNIEAMKINVTSPSKSTVNL